MAKLSEKEVRHVAGLAKLVLISGELEKFQEQLEKVLEYMEQLEEVDTGGIGPTSQTTGLSNVMREDEIDTTRVLTQKQALAGTEKTHNGYFEVEALLNRETE